MLKTLLKNNCHKFRKELLGNICLGLNKVLQVSIKIQLYFQRHSSCIISEKVHGK